MILFQLARGISESIVDIGGGTTPPNRPQNDDELRTKMRQRRCDEDDRCNKDDATKTVPVPVPRLLAGLGKNINRT